LIESPGRRSELVSAQALRSPSYETNIGGIAVASPRAAQAIRDGNNCSAKEILPMSRSHSRFNFSIGAPVIQLQPENQKFVHRSQ
jgi:hypothetical protein